MKKKMTLDCGILFVPLAPSWLKPLAPFQSRYDPTALQTYMSTVLSASAEDHVIAVAVTA